ncbi:hypothetical protein OQA88_3523 [Cercophora sp. LCS_1]
MASTGAHRDPKLVENEVHGFSGWMLSETPALCFLLGNHHFAVEATHYRDRGQAVADKPLSEVTNSNNWGSPEPLPGVSVSGWVEKLVHALCDIRSVLLDSIEELDFFWVEAAGGINGFGNGIGGLRNGSFGNGSFGNGGYREDDDRDISSGVRNLGGGASRLLFMVR